MKGLGIVVNVLAIILGTAVGSLIGRVPVYVKRLSVQAVGFVAMLLGAYALMNAWFPTDVSGVELGNTWLIVLALPFGLLFGEALCLSTLVDKLGHALSSLDRRSAQKSLTAGKASAKTAPTVALRTGDRFTDGFAVATALCALSSMSFTATIEEGLSGNHKALLIKAAIDAVLICALAVAYGPGVGFSVLPVLFVEGLMLFIAVKRAAWLTPEYMGHLSVISSVILIGTGINLAFGKRLRVINLIPAFFVGPFYWWAIMPTIPTAK